jgi:hypothetical protein
MTQITVVIVTLDISKCSRKYSRRPLAKGVLVVLLSSVASFFVLELLLRIFLPVRSFTAGTSNASNAPNAAIYGWGYRPGGEIKQFDPDTGEAFSTKANSAGWKDVEHLPKKADGSIRILILGDSQTFGSVPLRSIYPRVLEDLLRDAGFNAEIISMGYGGWSTDQALVALQRVGLSYQPDIVVSQFDTNDLVENLAISGVSVFKPFRFFLADGELRMRSVPPSQTHWLKAFLLRSHLIFYLNNVRWLLIDRVTELKEGRQQIGVKTRDWYASRKNPTGAYFVFHVSEQGDPGIEEAWSLYEKLIEQMKRSTEQKQIPFLIFNAVDQGILAFEKRWHRILEDEHGFHSIEWQGKFHPIYYYRHVNRLKAISQRIGALMIPNRRSYTRFNNDAHANVEGNCRMAEDIFDFLMINEKTSRILQTAQHTDKRA